MNTDMTTPTIPLDTSSLTMTKMSDADFSNSVYANLQSILKGVFRDCYEKQKIKKTSTGFNFACPICRDSASDPRKKRGNILLRGTFAGRFKCHNCGESMKLPWFFKRFDQPFGLSEMNFYSSNLLAPTMDSSMSDRMSGNVLDVDTAYQWAIGRDYIKNVLELSDITRDGTPEIWNYLVGRCQYGNHERFLYSRKTNNLIILNLVKGDRVLGLQIRDLNPNAKVRYRTMKIDKMREILLRDTTPVPDTIMRLSCIFNVFYVDFVHADTMPVLVTEGPFDAFLLPNCIAISGANNNFEMQFPFWYVYDNDPTGREHSMKMLRDGYKVLMWKKFMADYGLPQTNPYDKKNPQKWDVTDVMKYFRDYNVTRRLLWSPYFTNSALDGLNI